MHAFWLVLTYDLLEDRRIDDIIIKTFLILYYIKQIDCKLLCVCSVIDHRGCQNVIRISVTHSAAPLCATFLFLPHFDVICDLLLDRCMATWNLFVNYTTNWLLPNFSRSFEHRHPKDYVEKTSKFWDDLSSHKEQNKGNSRIIHSFVGLIYPNLIEEHCKFTVTENVLISVSVEPSFRGNPQNQESVS